MKTKIVSITLMIISFLFLLTCNNTAKNQEVLNAEKSESTVVDKKLRHVVLFKFNDTTPVDSIGIVEIAFADLQNKIPEIRDFEWGTDVSVEDLHNDFTHTFLVTFHSEEDRAAYLPHPDHQAFVKMVTPMLEDVLVIDYWVAD